MTGRLLKEVRCHPCRPPRSPRRPRAHQVPTRLAVACRFHGDARRLRRGGDPAVSRGFVCPRTSPLPLRECAHECSSIWCQWHLRFEPIRQLQQLGRAFLGQTRNPVADRKPARAGALAATPFTVFTPREVDECAHAGMSRKTFARYTNHVDSSPRRGRRYRPARCARLESSANKAPPYVESEKDTDWELYGHDETRCNAAAAGPCLLRQKSRPENYQAGAKHKIHECRAR